MSEAKTRHVELAEHSTALAEAVHLGRAVNWLMMNWRN
jgi:hypothetical protein